MNHRFVLPTLAMSALSFAIAAGAQAPQKKKPAPSAAATGRTATATTAPAPAASPAPTPSPAPAPAPEPMRVTATPRVEAPARKAAPTGERPSFGISAGLAAPMSSLGKAFSAGWTAGAFVHGRPASLPLGLRGDLQYTRFPGKNIAVDTSYAIIQLTGAAVYDFPSAGGGKSPFFATGGLGLYRWILNGESQQTDFGQNLGLGFNFRGIKFKPILESRFHFFNDVQYFTLTAGAHFR